MTRRDNPVVPQTRGTWAIGVLALGGLLLAGCGVTPSASSQTPPEASQEQLLLSQVEKNFQDPEAHYQLGEYYHSEGLWDKAEYQLNLAINFAPGFRKAQVALVTLLLDRGDRAGADAAVSRFLRRLASSPSGMIDLAKAFQEAHLDPYVLACLTEAARMASTSAQVFKELGLYWKSKKDVTQAKQYLLHSFDLDATQADVAEALGQLGVALEIPRPQPAQAQTPQP